MCVGEVGIGVSQRRTTRPESGRGCRGLKNIRGIYGPNECSCTKELGPGSYDVVNTMLNGLIEHEAIIFGPL